MVDASAYWPGDPDDLWRATGCTHATALARYHTLIHLRTPPIGAYAQSAVRIESAEEAARIDERIERAWAGHPRRFANESTLDFVDKVRRTLEILEEMLPACCRIPAA